MKKLTSKSVSEMTNRELVINLELIYHATAQTEIKQQMAFSGIEMERYQKDMEVLDKNCILIHEELMVRLEEATEYSDKTFKPNKMVKTIKSKKLTRK